MALNVAPLNAQHKELEWIPLADNDFQIKDMMGDKPHLQAFWELGIATEAIPMSLEFGSPTCPSTTSL